VNYLSEQAERISRLSVRVAHNMRVAAIIQSVLPGLTPSQLQILSLIDESGEPEVSMSEMARELAVTMPTVTGLVDQLIRRGLVSRRHDDKDRRRVLVSLTDAGRQALADVREAIVDLVARLLEGVSEEERESLVTAAERLHALSLEIRDEETAAIEARGAKRTA
jgi:DNA-binding MarR family transcriptional regulator